MDVKDRLAVIKYGGHAMNMPGLGEAFAKDVAWLAGQGMKIVIVHGGGPEINSLLESLKIESSFVEGLRVTDGATLKVVEMVLCGQVNKAVVRLLARQGAMAAGISGEDGGLLCARIKNPALGRVGEISAVNPDLLKVLLDGAFIPVVAPLALDEAGEPLNVNADTAAGALAGSLEADYFTLISDVPGVRDGEGHLLKSLTRAEAREEKEKGIISGGMIPKMEACAKALEAGCARAILLDGRQHGALRRFLAQGEPLGTLVLP